MLGAASFYRQRVRQTFTSECPMLDRRSVSTNTRGQMNRKSALPRFEVKRAILDYIARGPSNNRLHIGLLEAMPSQSMYRNNNIQRFHFPCVHLFCRYSELPLPFLARSSKCQKMACEMPPTHGTLIVASLVSFTLVGRLEHRWSRTMHLHACVITIGRLPARIMSQYLE